MYVFILELLLTRHAFLIAEAQERIMQDFLSPSLGIGTSLLLPHFFGQCKSHMLIQSQEIGKYTLGI